MTNTTPTDQEPRNRTQSDYKGYEIFDNKLLLDPKSPEGKATLEFIKELNSEDFDFKKIEDTGKKAIESGVDIKTIKNNLRQRSDSTTHNIKVSSEVLKPLEEKLEEHSNHVKSNPEKYQNQSKSYEEVDKRFRKSTNKTEINAGPAINSDAELSQNAKTRPLPPIPVKSENIISDDLRRSAAEIGKAITGNNRGSAATEAPETSKGAEGDKKWEELVKSKQVPNPPAKGR